MIREVAVLDVRDGARDAFEAAFAEAVPLIRASPGFAVLHLEHCIEAPQRYLLTVEWQSLEDHTVGFRESDRYQQWRALLHHFYDPFPTVEHYEPLLEVPALRRAL
jgi:heme-degrading monooxygenase HmoA